MASKHLSVLLVLSAFACAPQHSAEGPADTVVGESGVFTFAPKVGKTFEHVMKRTEEVQIIGTPVHQTENWETTWHITVGQEVDLVFYKAELKDLKVSINGADLLKGGEVTGQGGTMKILFDKNGRVVDIRDTQSLTDVLLQVTPADGRQAIAAMFSADNLKLLFLQRANERSDDLVSHSAKVGAVWKGTLEPGAEGHVSKQLKVETEEGCGKAQCVRVSRVVEIAPELVWSQARARVDDYMMKQGQDPTKVELTQADITIEDEFLVDPRNMEFHHAEFTQKATLSVKAPQGELSVAFNVTRESEYKY